MNKPIFPTRAEEIGYNLFDFFAKPPDSFYSKLLNNKATVLVGGRGTGKTMLLKSLAFDYKIVSQPCKDIWEEDPYLGCYIRIDTYIVTGFKGRGIPDDKWDLLFAHYFNLTVLLQIVNTLTYVLKSKCIEEKNISHFIDRYFNIIGEKQLERNIESVKNSLKRKLDELVRYINNPKKALSPTLINNGYLIFELCKVLNENQHFNNKTWFILLDEYENLSTSQQKIINTLIKANQPPVIFKVAMRPGGWWTKETLSETESLESIADYDLIDYQKDLSDEDFKQLVIDAFKRSLKLNGINNPEFQDIRKILPELDPDEEARIIKEKSSKEPRYEDEIINYINNYTQDNTKRQKLKNNLIIDNEPLKTRIHLVLLDKGKDPIDIMIQKNKNSQKYKNWCSHYRVGTLYLFCSEYSIQKIYSGFETYLLLSSKIMRNFVNLFARAWDFSIDEGFSPDNPKPFRFYIQSHAAYDVSQKKVFEIDSYAAYGSQLYSFANYLGRIFETLNKDIKQSQPERNHFSIKGDIDEKSSDILKSALLYSVLQEERATKIRSEIEVRDKDYLLNRIYCPYYNISYRKKHKLELKADEFEELIYGSDENKKAITKAILDRLLKGRNNPLQMNLLDTIWGEN